jgi:FtsH-binding integral membrane protein
MGPDPTLAYESQATRARPVSEARAVFGQTMGLVAFTLGFFALGAYIGRDISGTTGLILMLAAFIPLLALNVAVRRASQSLAITLLFAFGLLFGIGLGPVLAAYVTRRDLSGWGRTLMFALLGLIAFGILAIFVSIPGANVIYAVAGLVVFGLLTVFDFNRLRRAGMEAAPLIAASIFLDVVNVFLFFLQLFGGGRD